MTDKKTPLKIPGTFGSIYAGFWSRLGAALLDTLILLPYSALVVYINSLSIYGHYFTFVPGIIVHVWFNIYLVKKYGGTPGKLLLGIKIIKLDGNDVTWREAFLRQVVTLAMSVFGSLITLYGLSLADPEYYDSLGWLYKQQYIMGLIPVLSTIFVWTNNIWVYSELFVLLFNKRKRAIHDFMANTVIVKTRYLKKIREVMNAEPTPSTENTSEQDVRE